MTKERTTKQTKEKTNKKILKIKDVSHQHLGPGRLSKFDIHRNTVVNALNLIGYLSQYFLVTWKLIQWQNSTMKAHYESVTLLIIVLIN